MALLTCALTLAALAGCEPDRVVASRQLGADRVSAIAYPESVSVVPLCGSRFVIENHNDAPITVGYSTSSTGSQTSVVLRDRGAGLSFSEEYIVVGPSAGTLYVSVGTRSIRVTYPVAACPSRPAVSAAPPSGIELNVLRAGTAYWAADSARSNRRISLRRFYVGFKAGTPVAVRQALFDRLKATVLGGTGSGSLGEGDYFIEMPLPLDSGMVARDRVWRMLIACSAVARAGPDGEELVVPSGLAPSDGPGWKAWSLYDVDLSHFGWHFEMGHFPAAWGCSVNGRGDSLAIVDLGLKVNSDVNAAIANNVNSDTAAFHASRVASIAAALGNNNTGSVGGSWGTRVIYYDMRDTSSPVSLVNSQLRATSALGQATQRAVLSGARVVNLSLGYQNPIPADTLLRREDSTDVVRSARQLAQNYRNAWSSLSEPRAPLLVVSSANKARDAFWALLPAMRQVDSPFFSTKMLVVGGMSYSMLPQAWSSSGTGPLIDIAAPAERIHALKGANADDFDSGVSFAVPQVSAAAMLLLGFDSTLTADSLRQLLIDGAIAGGRTVQLGTALVPVLDAYQSLRILARRKGLPICGNRVWADGGTVKIERGTGTPDTLPSNPSPVVDLLTYHGGRKIAVTLANGSRNFYKLSAGTWNPSQSAFVDSFATTISGASRSAAGLSHDTLTKLVVSLVNADLSLADTTQPLLGASLDYSGSTTWSSTWSVPQLQPPLTTVRHAYTVNQPVGVRMPVTASQSLVIPGRSARGQIGNADTSWFDIRNQLLLVARPGWAVDPMGQFAYVAINQQLTSVSGVQPTFRVNCFTAPPDNGCRTVTLKQATNGVVLVRINLMSHQIDTLWRDPTANAHALAVSESGDELSFTLARDTVTWNAAKDLAVNAGSWYLQDWQGFTPVASAGPCYAGFRKLASIVTDSTYRPIASGCSTRFLNHGNALSSFGLIARTPPSRTGAVHPTHRTSRQ